MEPLAIRRAGADAHVTRLGWPAALRAPRGRRGRARSAARSRRDRARGHHDRPRPRRGRRRATWPTRSCALDAAGRARGAPRSPISAPEAGFRASRWRSRCPRRTCALVESVGRKCAFLAARGRRAGTRERARSSTRARRRGRRDSGAHDLVTARALAPLPRAGRVRGAAARAAAARSSPGRGRRDAGEEADGARGGAACGLDAGPRRCAVAPFPAARDRHLYLTSKVESYAGPLPAPAGNGPQTADPSLEVEGDGASVPNE